MLWYCLRPRFVMLNLLGVWLRSDEIHEMLRAVAPHRISQLFTAEARHLWQLSRSQNLGVCSTLAHSSLNATRFMSVNALIC